MRSTQSSKGLTLRQLKKKPKKYFRNLGAINRGRKKKTTIRYIVERAYDALPKGFRRTAADKKTLLIENLVNRIWYEGNEAIYDPYKALYDAARQTYLHGGHGETLEKVWYRFRTECPSQYAHYNTYMYRLGYSASGWYYRNGTYKVSGSIVTVTVELPEKSSGKAYEILEIVADMSDSSPFTEAHMY